MSGKVERMFEFASQWSVPDVVINGTSYVRVSRVSSRYSSTKFRSAELECDHVKVREGHGLEVMPRLAHLAKAG